MSFAPPEQGQLVDVRNRRCVVTEVHQTAPRADALTSERQAAKPQHLVTLSSVEDDGLGEELQVICIPSAKWRDVNNQP